MKEIVLFAILVVSGFASATGQGDKVYFENVKDGQTISSPFTVKFGVEGKKIRKAGEDAQDKTSGHHHLIIDGSAVPAGQVVPTDETHLHFGKGQTEAELKLKPGHHTLTLQFADGAHMSYGPGMSATVKVQVK